MAMRMTEKEDRLWDKDYINLNRTRNLTLCPEIIIESIILTSEDSSFDVIGTPLFFAENRKHPK